MFDPSTIYIVAPPTSFQIQMKMGQVQATKKIKKDKISIGHKMYHNTKTGQACIRYRGGKDWIYCGRVLSSSVDNMTTTWELRS